jgi:hypothetical protein
MLKKKKKNNEINIQIQMLLYMHSYGFFCLNKLILKTWVCTCIILTV